MTRVRILPDVRGRPPACSCCGNRPARDDAVRSVAVRDRRTGEPGELALCGRCLAGPTRTWRLRWTLIEDGNPLREGRAT